MIASDMDRVLLQSNMPLGEAVSRSVQPPPVGLTFCVKVVGCTGFVWEVKMKFTMATLSPFNKPSSPGPISTT